MKVKLALIGYGFLGKWHAEKAINNPNCELIAIVDQSNSNLEVAQDKYPKVKCVSNINEILNDVEGAIIATPTSSHFIISKILIENNKHIFCEKPVTNNFNEASELVELIKKNNYNKKFQVGHSERLHPIFSSSLKEIKSFILPNSFTEFNRLAPFKNRATDVDVVADLMIHDIDLMLFLFPGNPSLIKVSFGKKLTENIDFATAIFSFPGDILVTIKASRIEPSEERNFVIRSPKGYLKVDLLTKNIQINNDSSSYVGADHLQIENNAFCDSILNNSPEIVTFQDGVNAVKIVDTIRGFNIDCHN